MDEEIRNDVTDEINDEMDYNARREELFESLDDLLNNHKLKLLQNELEVLDEYDVASFLDTLPEHQMVKVFRLLGKVQGAEVFAELEPDKQEDIINALTDSELGAIIEEMYIDDAVDLMEELPANVVKRVMPIATPETRQLINQYLKYPEHSAGSIMTAEFIDLRRTMTIHEAFDRIREIGEDKESIYTCFVTSRGGILEGVVTVRDMILAKNQSASIESIMESHVIYARTTDDQEVVSNMFSDYDLLSIPVVDKERRLVGIITVDDIMDVIEEETTEDIEKMAYITPSDKPYLITPPFDLYKHRIPWLLLLMVSATFTGMIITSFEDALAAQLALTAFIPMLMDTGGNSGSQSSTTVIRAISLGDVEFKDTWQVIWKELRTSLMTGLSLAAANFVKIILIDRMLMHNDSITISIAAVVCLTLTVTVICSDFIGCSLPILAKKVGFDPAVMASPVITTIVDVVSLLVYFAFAKMLLGL